MQFTSVKARYFIGFAGLVIACFFSIHTLSGYSFVKVQLSSSVPTMFQVYWQTTEDQNWTEKRSKAFRVNSSKNRYILAIPVSLRSIDKLRIDPSKRLGVSTTIHQLTLHNLSSQSLAFGDSGGQVFSIFESNEQAQIVENDRNLAFISTGDDVRFIADTLNVDTQPQPILRLTQSVILALVLFSLIIWFRRSTVNLHWVSFALFAVACIAMTVSIVSDVNSHPDEYIHINNANYYKDHYIPSVVCSEDSLVTYSGYGVSRLDKREIAYYIGGRYLQLVDFIPAPNYLKLRFLNLILLFTIVFLSFRHLKARLLFLPLLSTPQAWYLFSYYNSDAFSLFSVAILGYQIFVPGTILRKLLDGYRPTEYVFWVFALSFLAAMQYWLKLNFVFYPIFLILLAASWWLIHRRIPSRKHTAAVSLAFLLGTILFFSWQIFHHAINDFELSAKVKNCSELTADATFKPSTPLSATDSTLRLRDKGVTIKGMLFEKQWPERIFFTGLGAYGYTEYLNSYWHYKVASGMILLFFFYVAFVVAFRGGCLGRLSVISAIATIAGVVIAAFINNWMQSFQPQGRYLLVFLPIVGTLLAIHAEKFNIMILSSLASIPFLMALYSFLAVALIELPKL